MSTVFTACNMVIMPFWVLMIFAPKWKVTRSVMASLLPIIALAAVYAVLVIPRLAVILPVVLQPGLAEVQALLGAVDGATIGWIHYLAFDLFVGRWTYLDSRERGISAWLMAPVLFLTLLLGPCGFLLYQFVGATKLRPAAS